MIIKASTCSALIVTAVVFVPCVNPVQAETGTKALVADSPSEAAGAAPTTIRRHARHAWRHRYVQRKSPVVAGKTDPEKSEPPAATVPMAADDSRRLPDIPPSIANANAQMLLAGVQLSAAAAIPAGSDARATSDRSTLPERDGGTVVAASDQLNDVDRSLQEGGQSPAALTSPPAPAATMAMTSESSVWDHTTLIGKIFIGFGALLTMASAARMFIA